MNLINKTKHFAHKPAALRWLAGFAFIEAIIFPIPADVILVAYGLLNRAKIWLAAAVATVASVVGGLFGYLLGYFFFAAVMPMPQFLASEEFLRVRELYELHGAWLVAIGGFTFLPYKLVTVTSGVMGLNVVVFLLASLGSRALRYFLVAAVVWVAPSVAIAVPVRYRLAAQAAFFAVLAAAAAVIYL